MNNAVFGKTIKNVEKIDLKLQKKEEETIVRTKLSYYKAFHKNGITNRNEKNSYINE